MICTDCLWKFPDSLDRCPNCGKNDHKQKSGIGLTNQSRRKPLARNSKPIQRNVRPKPISKRRKQRISSGAGEKKLFAQIWDVRKHECQNLKCDKKLAQPLAHYFAHIHSKGARPDLRLHPANIVLLCRDCEIISDQFGFDKIDLPEPYQSMRDTPPRFQPLKTF